MPIHPLADHPQALFLPDWKALGVKLFGEDKWSWKFCCPECKQVTTVKEHVDAWGGGLRSIHLGRKCPKCKHVVAPRPDYGPETCYRILMRPEDIPLPEDYPQGIILYVMPFWVDVPGTPSTSEVIVQEIADTVGEPEPPKVVPAPAPKKGAQSGYGFKF